MTATNKAIDAKVLDTEELVATIMTECKKAAGRAARKYGQSKVSDLEGFLIAEIWEMLSKKEEAFHTTMMIRRLIRLRTINHIQRDLIPFNNQIAFTAFESPESEDSFESTIADVSDFELGSALKDFKNTLSDKQRQILDLHTAGYGNNEIVDIVGCSINTPKNTMKKIKELAIQFGL